MKTLFSFTFLFIVSICFGCFGEDTIKIAKGRCSLLDSIIEEAGRKIGFELIRENENDYNLIKIIPDKQFDFNVSISSKSGCDMSSVAIDAFSLSKKTGNAKRNIPWNYIWEDIIRQGMGQPDGLSPLKLKNSTLFHTLKIINPPSSFLYLFNNNPAILKRHSIACFTVLELMEVSSITLLIYDYRNDRYINPIALTGLLAMRIIMLFWWGDVNSGEFEKFYKSGYLFKQRF